MRLKVQVNNNNVVKELCARGRGISWNVQEGWGFLFFEGEGSPGDREYAFLFLKYEYYTLI